MSTLQKSIRTDPVRTAVRFPLHLDVTISWAKGNFHAVTEDVSANGILFGADNPPPVGARIQFTLAMPAEIMGSPEDVMLHCIGRIVRHQVTAGKSMVAAVIDEYSLKAEHS
ncbi:MAG: PilZ domain-containing protein [Acidobacteriota bacterium]|nr:PilZ domain-containing protein [Acidobacteriota bacterium]